MYRCILFKIYGQIFEENHRKIPFAFRQMKSLLPEAVARKCSVKKVL